MAGAVVLLTLVAGCRSYSGTVTASGPACPATPAAPDPHRPDVGLDFRLSDDLHTVTGTERVRFTPDRATAELVFRLVPNDPASAAAGNRLTVDSVRGPDVAGGGYLPAAAHDPGGLYRVALRHRLDGGRATTVTLGFTLVLGRPAFDRVGADNGLAWWGSGAPLLAWEPGAGWVRDPFVPVLGETATSPAADTTVRVSAPQALTVLMTGAQDPPSAPEAGRRTWTSRAAGARDVGVAVGNFRTREVTAPGGTRVTVGVLPGAPLDADVLAGWTATAIGDLAARFGRFPYRSLAVPLLPSYGGGIEYPGLILLAALSRPVLVHEVAHMWFYGMVGDDQYRDPWLDEAFATYAEALVDPPSPGAVDRNLHLPGRVGDDIGRFRDDDTYFSVVYGKGSAALLTARRAAGPAAFDAALRCYVNREAWRIARPADVAAALAGLPAALRVLRNAGALPPPAPR